MFNFINVEKFRNILDDAYNGKHYDLEAYLNDVEKQLSEKGYQDGMNFYEFVTYVDKKKVVHNISLLLKSIYPDNMTKDEFLSKDDDFIYDRIADINITITF